MANAVAGLPSVCVPLVLARNSFVPDESCRPAQLLPQEDSMLTHLTHVPQGTGKAKHRSMNVDMLGGYSDIYARAMLGIASAKPHNAT